MEKTPMLIVKGHRILVKPLGVEKHLDDNLKDVQDLKAMGFTIAVDTQGQKVIENSQERGVVISIGNMAWKSPDLGYGLDGWEPWCKVGDHVTYARYAGKWVNDPDLTGEDAKFYLINDVDVQCVTKEA
jgi:co-chaperonin GroES (HSP10)